MTRDFYRNVPKDYCSNLRFRGGVIRKASSDPAFASAVKKMCSEDPLFYVNVFCWTYDPRGKTMGGQNDIPLITYPFQDDAIEKIIGNVISGRDLLIEKSRDMGASWMVCAAYEWLWHFTDSMSFLMVSRNEDYVDKKGNPKSLFWKIDYLHRWQPRWLLPHGRWMGWDDPERSLLHMSNAGNGSVIDGESTTGNAGRGDRRSSVLFDEFAAFDVDAGFASLSSSRDVTRCRIFLSTPKGNGNAFYEVRNKGECEVLRLHWSSHPKKNKGLYTSKDGKVKLLDDFVGVVSVFHGGKENRLAFPEQYPFVLDGKLRSPWYDRECSRCLNEKEVAEELDIDYAGSDYVFFNESFIAEMKKTHCLTPDFVGELGTVPGSTDPSCFGAEDKGHWSLWFTPTVGRCVGRPGNFVMGVDVSAGTGASNSTIAVYDCKGREKVAEYASPNILPDDFGRLVVCAAKYFNFAMIVPDRSGPTGEVCVKRILKEGYGNIYYSRNEKKAGRDVTDRPGVFLNQLMKTSLLEQYRDSLGRFKIINRSERAMNECLKFIRRNDGSVEHSDSSRTQDPSGARTAHGDIVIGDALANLWLCDIDSGEENKDTEPDTPENCLAYRIRMEMEAESAKKDDSLGEGWR